MRTADIVKSKYWRARDLEGKPPVTLTIADVTEEIMGRGGGHKDVKCFMWFHESPKGLQLNKSRVNVLEAAYGPESDLWSGKRVRLFFDPTVEFGGRPVGGVGIKTQPGVVYQAQAAAASWGAQSVPAGAPPPPVWDGTKWVTQPPAPAPQTPPPPVWNAATGKWDTVDPATGEITPPAAAPVHQPPQTISQRVNASHPPKDDGGWGSLAPPAAHAAVGTDAEFDDDIPF